MRWGNILRKYKNVEKTLNFLRFYIFEKIWNKLQKK